MPEGDSLHRAARRLQALVGERVEVETPHPRAAVKGLAERLDPGACNKLLLAVARARHPRRAARLRDDARAPAWRVAGAGDRRCPARPAARGRDREPVEGRGALEGARVAVARGRGGGRHGTAGRARVRAHTDADLARRTAAGEARLPAGRAALSRCGGVVRSAPQGENARTAYWCPGCQVGGNAPPS